MQRQSPGREAALAWASLAQRFPASGVLAREGAGCGSVHQQMVPVLLLLTGHGQALVVRAAEARPVLLLSRSVVSDSL